MENQKKKMDELLSELYYSFNSPVAYSGKQKLFEEAKKRNGKIKIKQVEEWLQSQPSYTLHKPVRINLETRRVIVFEKDESWQIDLVDLTKLSKMNDGYKFLLIAIDVFSKYVWIEPMKSKSALEVERALSKIFLESKRKPQTIQTDKGKEFLNRLVEELLKRHGIKLYTTFSERKASVVERVNRTIKGIMFKYFTKENTRRYIDVLQNIAMRYNNSYHRSIKMKPIQVTKENSPRVWMNLYEKDWKNKKIKPKFSVNDKVRVSSESMPFKKRYEEIWTEEIFSIAHVIKGHPIVYKIKDYGEEPIKGTFYSEELQKVTEPESFHIEKVIRKKKNPDGSVSCLVKWKGYPEKFNSYVLEKDLKKI